MTRFILNRLAVLFLTFLGITFITFLVINISPGKPQDAYDFSAKISYESKQRLVKLYQLDKPLHQRYFHWLKRLLVLDFGYSFKDDKPVIKKIGERLPATLLLNLLSMSIIFVLGCITGILMCYYHNKLFDKIANFFVFLGYSVPKYWLAILCMLLFGIKLGWLPISGLRSVNYDYLNWYEKIFDLLKHLILPVVIASIGGIAGLSQYVRGNMLEQLQSEYIKFAKSKGTKSSRIIFYHMFRNVLIPVVTILGLSLPELIGGGFVIEITSLQQLFTG